MSVLAKNNPIEFRSRLCAAILNTLARGDSCTVIGVGSSGKSNVAVHLARADVRARALGGVGVSLLGIYVDFQDFTGTTPPEILLALLEGLRNAASREDASAAFGALRGDLSALWERAAAPDASNRVMTYLADALRLTFSRGGIDKAFFILDDFDRVMRPEVDASALNALRKVRDTFRGQLAFAVFAWRELQFSRTRTSDYKDFFELVKTPVHVVGPYEHDDAQFMIDRLIRQSGGGSAPTRSWTAAERGRLIELSGGHAGLLRMIYLMAERSAVSLLASDAPARLAQRPEIKTECQTLWDSLDATESAGLRGLVSGALPGDATASRLRQKGLIGGLGAAVRVTSPVFEAWVATRPGEPAGATKATVAPGASRSAHVALDDARLTVTIDGREVVMPDRVSYALIDKVVNARAQPVPLRELLEVMLSHGPKLSRFKGSPEVRLSLTLTDLEQLINLPNRTYLRRPSEDTLVFA
ncbi:MAG: hypothetical protein K1X39_06645 [Thermoflexales bacterium]|nr:hypothetical protein [Thermoflexales bacterium]